MTDVVSPTYQLSPYRFSTDPAAMSALLETIGLTRVLNAADETFAVLQGQGGYVAVHRLADGAARAHTSLNFAVADVDVAADHLRRDGRPATVWDETYGRQGGLVNPLGQGVWLQEVTQSDLYGGYTRTPASGDERVDVTVVYASDDFARDAAYFAPFGFGPDPAEAVDDPAWCDLRSRYGGGVIGLANVEAGALDADELGVERADAGMHNPVGPPVLVGLGFESLEPLHDLAIRLTGAGHPAEVVTDEAGSRVVITDVDGFELEIFPGRPRRAMDPD